MRLLRITKNERLHCTARTRGDGGLVLMQDSLPGGWRIDLAGFRLNLLSPSHEKLVLRMEKTMRNACCLPIPSSEITNLSYEFTTTGVKP